MGKPASNLFLRIATAAVGVPAILALIFIAPPVAFYLFILAATILSGLELIGLTHRGDRFWRGIGALLTAIVSAVVYYAGAEPKVLLTLLIGLAVTAPLLTLLRPGDLEGAALRVAGLGFGPVYIGVPLTLLASMRRDVPHGGYFVLLALGFSWMSDTGGYFAGRAFGKRKLYELVSPKKTVEGAIGGLAAATLWGVALSASLRFMPVYHAALLGLVAAALGQAGDLGESLLKRSVGVKDSGSLLPGHGGLLDRVDALLVTASIVYLYTLWIG